MSFAPSSPSHARASRLRFRGLPLRNTSVALLLGACALAVAVVPGCGKKKRAASPTIGPDGKLRDPTRAPADRGAAPSGRPLSLSTNLDDAALNEATAHFIAFGDSGTGGEGQYLVAGAMARYCADKRCDFALHTGDIGYPRGIKSSTDPHIVAIFEKPYSKLGVPIYLSLGNHDHYGNPDAWIDAYGDGKKRRGRSLVQAHLPARYYTFFAKGVRFVALDTEKPTAEQGRWAWNVLRKSRRDREPWVVVFGHHPRKSYGAHGMPGAAYARWFDRVVCHHADLFIAGHDHDKQLLEPHCGVHQVISGAAGHLRDRGSGPDTVFTDGTLGFAAFRTRGAELRVSFHDLEGKEQFARTLTRSRPVPVCGADLICNGLCKADPDCAKGKCKADKRCDTACTDDPDCGFGAGDTGACPCDRTPGVCEARSSRSNAACACDPSCQAGFKPCAADGYCDRGCPSGSDTDCS